MVKKEEDLFLDVEEEQLGVPETKVYEREPDMSMPSKQCETNHLDHWNPPEYILKRSEHIREPQTGEISMGEKPRQNIDHSKQSPRRPKHSTADTVIPESKKIEDLSKIPGEHAKSEFSKQIKNGSPYEKPGTTTPENPGKIPETDEVPPIKDVWEQLKGESPRSETTKAEELAKNTDPWNGDETGGTKIGDQIKQTWDSIKQAGAHVGDQIKQTWEHTKEDLIIPKSESEQTEAQTELNSQNQQSESNRLKHNPKPDDGNQQSESERLKHTNPKPGDVNPLSGEDSNQPGKHTQTQPPGNQPNKTEYPKQPGTVNPFYGDGKKQPGEHTQTQIPGNQPKQTEHSQNRTNPQQSKKIEDQPRKPGGHPKGESPIESERSKPTKPEPGDHLPNPTIDQKQDEQKDRFKP